MNVFFSPFGLITFLLALGTALPVGAREYEVRFTHTEGGASKKGLMVYVADRGDSPIRKLGRIDERGRIVDTFDAGVEPPKRVFRRYFVVPDNNPGWKLAKATNQAPPSAEALLADRELLEDLAHEVKVEWQQDEQEAYYLAASDVPPPRHPSFASCWPRRHATY